MSLKAQWLRKDDVQPYGGHLHDVILKSHENLCERATLSQRGKEKHFGGIFHSLHSGSYMLYGFIFFNETLIQKRVFL